jgi:hypothetical protein
MGKLLLSLHVLAAIVFVGPVTVAVSLFPRYARLALTGAGGGDPRAVPVVRLLHRVSRVYAVLGLSVPVLGIALAVRLGVLTDAWVVVSTALTLAAAGVLAAAVLPAQQRALDLVDPAGRDGDAAARWTAGAGRLAMFSGIFALLWAVVVVLMVVRPGSTTGV